MNFFLFSLHKIYIYIYNMDLNPTGWRKKKNDDGYWNRNVKHWFYITINSLIGTILFFCFLHMHMNQRERFPECKFQIVIILSLILRSHYHSINCRPCMWTLNCASSYQAQTFWLILVFFFFFFVCVCVCIYIYFFFL